jgi:hypothetical protein
MQHVKTHHRPTIVLVASLLLAALAACGNIAGVREITATQYVRQASEAPRVEEQGDDASIIAEIGLESGGLIRFTDEAEGVDGGLVGILEITAHDAAPLAASFRAEQVTPLERFLSVTSDRQVPARLVSRHRAMAHGSSVVNFEPCTLSVDTDAATCHRH